MGHLHPIQSLDGLDRATAEAEASEGGKMDVGDFLYHCFPIVALYVVNHLHRRSLLTPH